eukprot:TRINITY_DN9016_c0_g1_i1.p1 TRINITY_DN9016_c0_g1~~TRINITY_DN9016_c0_g1_i1.p1  ORF type:complete len:3331 (-),score=769.45 TRINITY_DN9016_c0_g1_i1:152-10144(-)
MAPDRAPMELRQRSRIASLFQIALVLVHELRGVVAAINDSFGKLPPKEEASLESLKDDLRVFSAPSPEVEALAQLSHNGADPARRLALAAGWQWPAQTTLTLTTRASDGGAVMITDGEAGPKELTVCANVHYESLKIKAAGETMDDEHKGQATIKLVKGTTERYQCSDENFDYPVGIVDAQNFAAGAQAPVYGEMGKQKGPLRVLYENQDELWARLAPPTSAIVFMMGGTYRICYTPDGIFGTFDGSDYKENMLLQDIHVLGVKSPCAGGLDDGCIEKETFDCFFGYRGESVENSNTLPFTGCIFNFMGDGGLGELGWDMKTLPTGGKSRMTWSTATETDADEKKLCKSVPQGAPAVPGTFDVTSHAEGMFLTVDRSGSVASMPTVVQAQIAAFTIAVCYCPNYDMQTGTWCTGSAESCCDSEEEFIQMFGTLYYWTIRICDYDDYQRCGEERPQYRRVLPHQKFTLRVQCPPHGGCKDDLYNKVKFLDPTQENDRPNWSPLNGCKKTSVETLNVEWPNIGGSGNGGNSKVYKHWHGVQVKLSLMGELDLCYAHSAPPLSNWFRIGTVKVSEAFSLASKTGAADAYEHLKYMNFPGSITFFGGITTTGTVLNPWDGNRYSGSALLNLISFDREEVWGGRTVEKFYSYDKMMPETFQSQMDKECQRERYSETLVDGPSSRAAAKDYMAVADPNNDLVTASTGYMPFAGETGTNTMKVKKAGVVAICYCALVADGVCKYSDKWVYAGRTTIRGPDGSVSWVFPSNVVVGISVNGWGLSSNDRLRIIPFEQRCGEGVQGATPYDPVGKRNFKVGCPGDTRICCCRSAREDEDLVMTANSADNSEAFITTVEIARTYTTLTFSKDLNQIPLQQDDMITIDRSQIKISGTTYNPSMTPDQLYEVYKFTGEHEFYPEDQSKTFMVAHRLSEVAVPGGVDPRKMTIPVGWPPDVAPQITFFEDAEGYWTQRNIIHSKKEIKGKGTTEQMRVCWGSMEGSVIKYYAEAGRISFTEPPTMPEANTAGKVTVSFTAKERGVIAPVVITFETGDRAGYTSTTGMSQLVLRFLDVSVEGALVPMFSGDVPPFTGRDPADLGDRMTDEVKQEDMRQNVCGKLFLELWSEHPDGFPLAAGCYYSLKYKDSAESNLNTDYPLPGHPTPPPDADPSPQFYRELVIVFGPGSGLRPKTKYQMVMNAVAKSDTVGVDVIDLYAMCAEEKGCDGYTSGGMVFEKGTAKTASVTLVPGGDSDPNWADGSTEFGVTIERGETASGGESVMDLSRENVLQLQLAGGNDNQRIRPGEIIRLFLWPLTMWDIGGNDCLVECIAFYGAGSPVCNWRAGYGQCKSEQVVTGSESHHRFNVIKLKLPATEATMTPITSTVMHTVKITGLALPSDGFFPIRMGAELYAGERDDAPRYTRSYNFIFKQPEYGQTTGRIVLDGRTGYGPDPFEGASLNILYVRLQFGATLWNNGQMDGASVELTLPEFYSCSVPVGEGEPPIELPVFRSNQRGVLSDHNEDGSWAENSVAGRLCVYDIKQGNAIFARQVAYVKLTVANPPQALEKSSEKNVWEMRLLGKGSHRPPSESSSSYKGWEMPRLDGDNPMYPVTFISLGEELNLNRAAGEPLWAANAAVISSLTKELIQPSDFRRSCCGSTYEPLKNFIRIFFMSGRYVGRNGYVVVDAPPGFDFGETCSPRDLDEAYYGFIGDGAPSLLRLRQRASCKGQPYPIDYNLPAGTQPNNRAKVRVGGVISNGASGRGEFYGFEIKVEHPQEYDVSQQSNWFLWTEDSNGYGIEGSSSTVRFNPEYKASQTQAYDLSFGMYRNHPSSSADRLNAETASIAGLLTIADRRPADINGDLPTTVTFYYIMFDVLTDTSLRISAPDKYIWMDSNMEGDTGFIQTVEDTTELFPYPSEIPNTNQLVWPFPLTLRGGYKYGFTASIKLPPYSPVTSSNTFFIEFGYTETLIERRLLGMAIDAPMLAAVTNAQVSYASNLEGYQNNLVEFAFQTWTSLEKDQGVIIEGDQSTTGFEFISGNGWRDIGDATFDRVYVDMGIGFNTLPRIQIKAYDPIMPGNYRIEVGMKNPPGKTNNAGTWTFGTYSDLSLGTQSAPVDKALGAAGFQINVQIQDANFVYIDQRLKDATLRDDRPGRNNQLIFFFKMTREVVDEVDLTLRGPRGFLFDDDCTQSVIVDENLVFGPDSSAAFPVSYTYWPQSLKPKGCQGNGRQAKIRIPAGLMNGRIYCFRMGVLNPPVTPEWNFWSIDYHKETSTPFPGFNIWANTLFIIDPATTGMSSTEANAVQTINAVDLTFIPYNSVPKKERGYESGGLMIVLAPDGFVFLHDENDANKCQVDLLEESTDAGGTGSWTPFEPTDIECQVDVLSKMLLHVVGKQIIGGKKYKLITYVYNPISPVPVQPWFMRTYKDMKADTNGELDVSSADGFSIDPVLQTYTVTNVQGIRDGKAKVPDVEMTLQFPDPLWDGDIIRIWSPKGFNIMGDPETQECNEFRWPDINNIPLPRTYGPPPPFCQCDNEDDPANIECWMWIPVLEDKEPAFRERQDITFRIATENPAKTPFVMDNYWKIQHTRKGEIKSTRVAPSWIIRPQLDDVDIRLPSAPLAAGSDSDIEFRFKPVNDARVIKIVAVAPSDFNFASASVAVPYDIDKKSERNTVIINDMGTGFKAGVPQVLRINNVRLGRGGGQTIWSLETFKSELAPDGTGIKMDEKLLFKQGFRLPGRLMVTGQEQGSAPMLRSVYQEQPDVYPVKSLFQPRFDEEAKAEFTLTMTQTVTANQLLIIACTGPGAYTIKDTPFVIIGRGGQVPATAQLNDQLELESTLKPGMPANEPALEADIPYMVLLRVVPKEGSNTWRFDTTDLLSFPGGMTYPTNTNDAEQITFTNSPVKELGLIVNTVRSPPGARINVELKVDRNNAVIRELLIVAPPAFIFPPTGCGNMCLAGQAQSGRRTATIASPTGEPLTNLDSIMIQVITPEKTPASTSWFVEGRGQGGSQATGWGEGAGFLVNQMANSAAMYPGVANLKGAMISFTFTLDVDAGSQITVIPPTGYLLTCSTEGALRQISLPGRFPECVDDPLELILSQTLTVGTYAFAISVDVPAQTPSDNTFSIVIKNQDNQVVDAAYGLPGQTIVNMGVGEPILSWDGRPEPGERIVITFGMTFSAPTTGVKAVLLNFPDKFIHDVQRPTDVQNLNKRFRVAAGQDWADTSYTDRLQIRLDDSTEGLVIDADTYMFNLPVMVPCCTQKDLPKDNVWKLSLCSSLSCKQPGDPEVILTMAMAGFDLDELSSGNVGARTGAAPEACHLAFGVRLLLALFALCMPAVLPFGA